ncbi:putative aldehyde dehydrogenase protein [Phaeoacremonium minimum UCRPA7]|uniref:aldehyde dehydrogenase (NAD(+)) n=1 Tax=Phaeoacremonium minimum (strain UCR-PA7) TaxID=1286976 RepID=R8BAZ5_PHAM7|nr:putative aldehyde dehydrogenase protein [Phaeoacremonium minimum UCRPA7]EON96470.1 putative aldehyde dehydrogenase protein [Phaeoacremonium minimum UCRPA7]
MADLEVTLTAPNGQKISLSTGLFINNEFIKGSSSEKLASIDPATEETIVEVEVATADDVDKAVKAARAAFNDPTWRDMIPEDRAKLLNKVADLIDDNKDELFALQAWDVGKPYGASQALEWPLVVQCLRYYAGWADKINGQTIPISSDKFGYTIKQPVGVCGAISPWNFPLVNCSWKIGPALATGCCIIMKPSEFSPLSALFLAKLFKQAGYPPGVVQVVNGWGKETGDALTKHLDIDKIAFTGSTATGRAVIKAAAVNMKKVTVEAGGKSAFIVFDDADLEQAAKWAIAGGMGNAGQICSANARILVQEGAHEKFVKYFSDFAKASKIGRPFDEGTTQGPQVSKMQYDKVLEYLDHAKTDGANLVTGGNPYKTLGKGYFIEPTIYTGVTNKMKIFHEEIFGPVIAVTTFKTEDEAVALANDSAYGLAGMVFTENMKTAMRTATKLHTGMVWINESNNYNVKMPFGGVKQSGLGRELGESTLEAYLEEKVVHVNLGLRI